jgi:hypothetical protein
MFNRFIMRDRPGRRAWRAPVFAGLLALPGAASALEPPEIFVFPQGAAQALEGSSASQAVKLNAGALLGLPEGGVARLTLPRLGRFDVVYDRTEQHLDGGATWVGHFKEYGSHYRLFLTAGSHGVSGLIVSPDGEFSLAMVDGQERLRDLRQAGFQGVSPGADDARRPPAAAAAAALAAAPPADNSVVDLLIVYTPGMAQRYGDGLRARLDTLVAIANQAYIDSGVRISLRLAHAAQVEYSDTAPIDAALDDLTKGAGSLAGVAALRAQYGADLVQLLRPYRRSIGSCGLAWIGTPPAAQYGYSVAEDGADAEGAPYYCYDLSLVHELGHNMGAAHDRAHANGPGAYEYSYGYGIGGKFATIMAAGYVNATPVAKFSSPALACAADGTPCGIAPGLPGAADNAQTLNNTRVVVAAFAGPDPRECLFDWAESFYPGLFSPRGAGTQTLAPYVYRYYAGTNAYVGVSSADNHVYYLGPDGVLLDVGDLSAWLPLARCQ